MEVVWKDVHKRTKDFVKEPDRFLVEDKNGENFEKCKILLKVLYDGAKMATENCEILSTNTLPELIIEDFDEEQVWAGVELQNKVVIDDCQAKIAQLLSGKMAKKPEISRENDSSFMEQDEESDEEEDDFKIDSKPKIDSENSEDDMDSLADQGMTISFFRCKIIREINSQ